MSLQINGPTVTVKATGEKLYSVPIHKADKEYLLNASVWSGLSQKDLIGRAIIELKKNPPARAMPIKL